MLEGIKSIRLESISGNFYRTAEVLRVSHLVVHRGLLKPRFLVNKEDRCNSHTQRGVLHLSVTDLAEGKLPEKFDLKSMLYIQLQNATLFPVAVKIGSIEVGRGVIIGAGTKIGQNVTIGDDTRIGPDCIIKNSQIGKQTHIRRDSIVSFARIGDHTEVGVGAVINNLGFGMLEIGNWVRIEAGSRLRGQSIASGQVVNPR